MKSLFLGLALAALAASGCGQPPLSASPVVKNVLAITPSGTNIVLGMDPFCFKAENGDGRYQWSLDIGYGQLYPRDTDPSWGCFTPYGPGPFDISVTSAGQKIAVAGQVIR